MKYVLAIGTNIGDRAQNIKNAVAAVSLLPNTSVIKESSVYETSPVGYDRQENFYNMCLIAESDFEPGEMLAACLGIEAGLGRVRKIKNGPRIIDIDVIFAENKIINTKNLILPHPRYHERLFVLCPLEELFPEKAAYGIDFSSFSKKITDQKIRKI